jgi:hypothetical protein
MPRERIQHGQMYLTGEYLDSTPEHPAGIWREKYDQNVKQPENTRIRQDPSVDITWNRAGWVQISFDIEREQWIENAKELEAEGEQPYTVFRGIYSESLSRSEINNIIKVLRKARDQAYGADE